MMSRRKAPEDLLIQPRHEWNSEERDFIIENLPGKSYAAVAEMISERFGWKCEYYHVRKYCHDTDIAPGKITGRAEKNEIGTERLRYVGRKGEKIREWYVKVGIGVEGADKDGWKRKHIVEWEKVYGKVPKGCVLLFADGNTENWHVENLTLATLRQRSQRAQLLNHHGIRSYDQESSQVLNTLADLMIANYDRRNKPKKQSTDKTDE